jgi:hypothetical protein
MDVTWVVVFAVVVAAWLLMRRANELCALRLSPDGARLVRGRAPAGLLSDANEVARRAALRGVTVRVVTESGEPRLVSPPGVPEAVVQQLRNVVGQYRVVHFRTGKRAD